MRASVLAAVFGVACVDAAGPIGADDSASTPDSGDGGGGAELSTYPCEAPGPLGWTLREEPEPFGPIEPGDTIEAGNLGVFPVGEGVLVTWVTAKEVLRYLPIGVDFAVQDWPAEVEAHSMSLGDLDGSGVDDLLILGREPLLFRDFPTQPTPIAFDGLGLDLREATPGDVDGDGDLDLVSTFTGAEVVPAARITLNRGDGSFDPGVEVSDPGHGWGKTFDTTVLDIDGDTDPDFYVCSDMGRTFAPNALYLNDGGHFVASDEPAGAGVAADCMGSHWGDLDGDGHLDIVLGDAERVWLLQYVEGLGFVDVTGPAGIPTMDPKQMGWGVATADLDNDTRNDLLVATSWFREGDPPPAPLWVALQADGGRFPEVGEALGFPREADTRTVVPWDLNHDGVLDLFIGDGGRTPWVYLSDGCTEAGWLEVTGPEGTVVTVEAGGRTLTGRITTDGGFGTVRPRDVHFGLGDATTVDRVTWWRPWQAPVSVEGPIPARSVVRWTDALAAR